jgi:hypothetical protein
MKKENDLTQIVQLPKKQIVLTILLDIYLHNI